MYIEGERLSKPVKKHSIVICMGSSCFARGNKRNLKIIEEYLQKHALDCTLSGRGCTGNCRGGPNLQIDGENFERVDPESLIDLLDRKLMHDSEWIPESGEPEH